MQSKKYLIFNIFACLLLLTAVVLPFFDINFASASSKLYSFNYGLMGEPVFGSEETNTISIRGTFYGYDQDKLNDAKQEILDTLRELDNQVSTVNPGSDIYKFNHNINPSGNGRYYLREHTYHLVKTAKDFHNNTAIYNGKNAYKLFEPTIYPLMELWGLDALQIDEDKTSVPTTAQINAVLPLVDFSKVALAYDEEVKQYYITKTDSNIKLDFGGQAKGYGADLVAEICKNYELDSATFDLGGNAYLYKDKPLSDDGQSRGKWSLAVNNPIYQKGYLYFSVLELSDISAVTSGDYNRFYYLKSSSPDKNTVKYAHTINPYTGLPVNIERDQNGNDKNISNGLTSVTIFHQNSELADIYATVVTLLGIEDGIDFLEKNNLSGILITNDYKYAAVGDFTLAHTDKKDYHAFLDNYTPYKTSGGKSYPLPQAKINNLTNWIKTNWIYFVIGICGLTAAGGVVAIALIRKKKQTKTDNGN